LAAALATSAYSLVIAAMSIRQEVRIVADISAASISVYAVLTTIILGATSLYRELELKTIFPVLTRRLRRHEYVVGKYFGILATMVAFIAIDGATALAIMAFQSRQHVEITGGVVGVMAIALVFLLVRAKYSRVFVVLPWAVAFFLAMALCADGAGSERQVLVLSCFLTLGEVAIVAALAMVFSSFSSPALTAIFTVMLFLIGRSTDTLGNIPARQFGTTIRTVGIVLAKIVPNLTAFVPARPLLLGQVPNVPLWGYIGRAWLISIAYACVLLTLSAVIFRKRDFQ
jgi:Cu-processing system permease protein